MNRFKAFAVAGGLVAVLSANAARAETCNPPRILLVMDASSSMLGQITENGVTTTKWEAVQTAVAAVFGKYADAAQYGLMTFPGSTGGCSTGEVTVQVAAGTASTIQSTLLNMTIPSNNQTPAGQSLVAASKYAGITNSANPNYVIFMTDGWQYCSISTSGAPQCATSTDCSAMNVSPCPTCNSCQVSSTDPGCSGQNPDGCYCVRSWPIKGVEALKAAGVPTYVVGFGTETDVQTLNKAADAGGTATPGCDPNSNSPSCYLQATSPSELTTALSSIIQAVVTETCSGDCGIQGTRTCTAAGWSDCDAPATQSCQASCGQGTQTCTNGVLGPCDAPCLDAGTGGSAGSAGAGGSSGSAATGGTGNVDAGMAGSSGAAATGGGSGKADDSGDDGGCGCRVTGSPVGPSPWWALGLGLGLVARRRRRRTCR